MEIWLWLWVGGCLTQGEPWPSCPQCQPGAEGTSYELIRVPQSFPAAQAWCQQHRGQLLHTWDQHSAGFLQGQLDNVSKSWVGSDAATSLEEQQASNRGISYGEVRLPHGKEWKLGPMDSWVGFSHTLTPIPICQQGSWQEQLIKVGHLFAPPRGS